MKKNLFAAALLISMIFTGCQQNNFSEAFEPETAVSETKTVSAATKFDVKNVPAYSGSASVEINQNHILAAGIKQEQMLLKIIVNLIH